MSLPARNMDAWDFRRQFGAVVDDVRHDEVRFMVQRYGADIGAFVPAADLRALEALAHIDPLSLANLRCDSDDALVARAQLIAWRKEIDR